MPMDDLCKTKHVRVDEVLDSHDVLLSKHDQRIDLLERAEARSEVRMSNLCERIDSLISAIKWSMGMLVTSLIGFVIWYIQNIPRI